MMIVIRHGSGRLSVVSKPICIVFTLVIINLVACTYFSSWNGLGNSWVGSQINEILELWGQPDEIISGENNEKEYKYRLPKIDPSCIHYWMVNNQGTIVGFHYQGRCDPV